jgi:hypothetical protein
MDRIPGVGQMLVMFFCFLWTCTGFQGWAKCCSCGFLLMDMNRIARVGQMLVMDMDMDRTGHDGMGEDNVLGVGQMLVMTIDGIESLQIDRDIRISVGGSTGLQHVPRVDRG